MCVSFERGTGSEGVKLLTGLITRGSWFRPPPAPPILTWPYARRHGRWPAPLPMTFGNGATIGSMAAPKGHIRKHGDGYQVAVPVGRDPVTARYRYAYESSRNLDEAKERREEMVGRIADGREPTVRATAGELLDKWLAVAELELTAGVWYEGYIAHVIRPVLGDMRLRELERPVDILDGLYAGLRPGPRVCRRANGL